MSIEKLCKKIINSHKKKVGTKDIYENVTIRKQIRDINKPVIFVGAEEIELEELEITDEQIITLAKLLKVDEKLKRLNLRHNLISDAGAEALAEALEINTTLECLRLEFNKIGDEGAIALAKSLLEKNMSLKRLGIDYNLITPEGISAFDKPILMRQNGLMNRMRLKGCTLFISASIQSDGKNFIYHKHLPKK